MQTDNGLFLQHSTRSKVYVFLIEIIIRLARSEKEGI